MKKIIGSFPERRQRRTYFGRKFAGFRAVNQLFIDTINFRQTYDQVLWQQIVQQSQLGAVRSDDIMFDVELAAYDENQVLIERSTSQSIASLRSGFNPFEYCLQEDLPEKDAENIGNEIDVRAFNEYRDLLPYTCRPYREFADKLDIAMANISSVKILYSVYRQFEPDYEDPSNPPITDIQHFYYWEPHLRKWADGIGPLIIDSIPSEYQINLYTPTYHLMLMDQIGWELVECSWAGEFAAACERSFSHPYFSSNGNDLMDRLAIEFFKYQSRYQRMGPTYLYCDHVDRFSVSLSL